jgi:PAS domain S-box-containing protein
MEDSDKPREELVRELNELRRRLHQVEGADAGGDRCQEALQRISAEQHTLLSTLPVMIFSTDLDGRFIRVNDAFAAALGKSPDEISGKSLFELYPEPIARAHHADNIRVIQSGESSKPIEKPVRTPAGTIWVATEKFPYRDGAGNVIGIIGYSMNITERKLAEETLREAHEELERRVAERTAELLQANRNLQREIHVRERVERALREGEEKYRAVVERASDGIALIQEGLMKYVNPRLAEMAGYTVEEVIGTPFTHFVHPDELPEAIEFYQRRMAGEPLPTRYERTLRRKDGRSILTEIDAAVVTYEGKPANLAIIRDITDRKEWEEKLRQTLRERETLLREIHHRVKNNLQVVTSLLSLSTMHTQNQEAVDLLTDACSRIQAIALTHTQLYESDQFDRINMDKHIRQLVENLSQTYGASERSVTPVIECSRVDLTLNQAIPCALVLNELLSNVYKHAFREGQRGTVEISLRRTADGMVELRVRDDGVGLPEDMRIDELATLGLQLVRDLVLEQLRGELEVLSSPGTEFFITFQALNLASQASSNQ